SDEVITREWFITWRLFDCNRKNISRKLESSRTAKRRSRCHHAFGSTKTKRWPINCFKRELSAKRCSCQSVRSKVKHHEGPARVYDTEEEASQAIQRDEVQAGDVLVIRHVGPKG